MKKYNLFLVALMFVVIAACTKSGDSNSSSFTYTVESIPNYTATEYVDTTFAVPVSVTLVSGSAQGTLTLTPTGMPAGVTVIPASFVGMGTFTTAFAFTSDATVSGTYPITINATNSSGTKSYSFNLVIGAGSLFSYTVTGLSSNITLSQYCDTTISLPVTVTYGSGTAESVSLSSSTPPAGITFSVTPNTATPTYTSTVAMHVAINTPGTYPVTINSTAAGTAPQAHTFNVVVTASSNCATEAVGTYSMVSVCSNTIYNYNSGGNAVAALGTNEVRLPTPYANLTADLNCSAGTLTTQSGLFGPDFYFPTGNGTFNSSTIVLNLTLDPTSSSDTATCVLTYTRQ